ncbi:MAG: alpha/beta fold hydrolase [Burkholderiales bacterium]
MATIEIDNPARPGGKLQICFEDRGEGIPIVLTPGGRWGGYVMRAAAGDLCKDYRVITWDRPNTDGASTIVTEGEVSEADIWADCLAALIRELKLAPCYVGEYAGCRTTPLLCLKYPELVRGWLIAWPSGGEVPAERLPRNMHRPYIRAALREGMQAVAQTPMYAEAIRLNPSNHALLQAIEPLRYVRQMAFWESFFTTSVDLPTAGCRMNDAQWSSIKLPAVVTGGEDPMHPTDAARRIHKLLAKSKYHDPVVSLEEWDKVFNILPYPEVSDLQGARIAPVWRDFIEQNEKQRTTT